jgi:hypothetical protein
LYRHFEGELVTLVFEGVQRCDGGTDVVFISLKTGIVHSRPQEEFFSYVKVGGTHVPRYEPVRQSGGDADRSFGGDG